MLVVLFILHHVSDHYIYRHIFPRREEGHYDQQILTHHSDIQPLERPSIRLTSLGNMCKHNHATSLLRVVKWLIIKKSFITKTLRALLGSL